jgi:hypothetical protein
MQKKRGSRKRPVVCQTISDGRPPAASKCPKLACAKKIPLPLAHLFFAQVVNSCWLAPAHAYLAQTFPKIFKNP